MVLGRAILIWTLSAGAAAAEPLRVGTTFSPRQCRYLELDAERALEATLETPFELIRLSAYWDELEPEPGVFDFSSLDWQIAQAQRRQVPIVLAVGMKAPRWPEYFIPHWVLKHVRAKKGSDVSKSAYLRERTLLFIEAVVRRYRDEPLIRYWQVENEPLDRTGPGFWWISPKFLKAEVALVRRLDGGRRPIVLTTVTYPNKPLRWFMYLFIPHDTIDESLRLGDILGVNVYPVVGHKWLFRKSYFWTTPAERRAYLLTVLERVRSRGKALWVTELQAEPWEPEQLVYTAAPTPPTADPARLAQDIEELRALGVEAVLLWGAEYWHFRKVRHHDTSWGRQIRRLLYKPPALDPAHLQRSVGPGLPVSITPTAPSS